jgi:hypothetical protein
MHLAGLLLSGALLFAPPSGREEATANATQAMFDRVAKMSPAEQQQWLRDLEKRALRAGRLALPPDEAATHEARIKRLLHQQIVPWKSLRAIIEETGRLELDNFRKSIAQHAPERPQPPLSPMAVDVRRTLPRPPEAPRSGPLPPQATASRPTEDVNRIPVTRTAGNSADSPRNAHNAPAPILGRHPARLPAIEPAAALADMVASESPKASAAEPASILLPTETQVVPPATSPADESDELADEPPAGSVQVDVAELAARIAGCNLAFRTVEAELDEKSEWNAQRLGHILDRVNLLTIRRNDLNLFREVVPEQQRTSLKRLESPKSLIAQLGGRIFEARCHANGPNFKGSDAERQAELQRLEELSRRLAELAGK